MNGPLGFLSRFVFALLLVLRATFHSGGLIGVLLTVAFFGALIWLCVDMDIVKLNDQTLMVWLVKLVVAGVLAIRMSWSHLPRMLTGQGDVADGKGP
jgi:hypothetical protein